MEEAMALEKSKKGSHQYRSDLLQLQKKRYAIEAKKRKDGRGYSLEGLRLGSLLNQLSALQAVQGLQELKPNKERGQKRRFTIPEDPKERSLQRRWLMFKADWLQALLEDTIDELEALNQYEASVDAKVKTERRRYPRKLTQIAARYEATIHGSELKLRLCRVLNICVGGLKLISNDQIGTSTDIKVIFQDGTNLPGTVIWSRKIEDQARYHTGVQFKRTQDIIDQKTNRLTR